MELTGDFFLCRPAYAATSLEGEHGVLFALRQPAPSTLFPNGLLAAWFGPAANAFMHTHAAELRPGRGMRVQLQRLTAKDGDIRARVQSCELLPLPPSWVKHEQQDEQPTTQHA